MKVSVKTLQEALTFLGLAVSKNNSDRPLTKMIEFFVEDNFLVGVTCNSLNIIKYKICPTDEKLEALVEYELLNNIIKSCDSDIELKSETNALSIRADNMKCKITSRKGTTMPKIGAIDYAKEVNFSGLGNIIPICKTIINPSFMIECYKHIYFDDYIMASDTNNVVVTHRRYFDEPVLLSQSTVEIFSRLKKAEYNITKETHASTGKEFKKVYVKSDNIEICSMSNYMDKYQYQDLRDLFSADYKDVIFIPKEDLSKAYTAAKLFKNATIKLVFNIDEVYMKIDRQDFIYHISNEGATDKHEFIASDSLMKKLLAINGDLRISFGDNLIKCSVNEFDEIFSVDEL